MPMSLGLMRYFIVYNTFMSIVALVTLAVVATVFMIIIRRRRTELLQNSAKVIDIIPFFAGLIPLAGLLTEIYKISDAFTSGVPEKIFFNAVSAGFQEFFLLLLVSGGLFFIFMEAWLVLRMIYGRFLRELNTLQK
jgi:hypothetical protein